MQLLRSGKRCYLPLIVRSVQRQAGWGLKLHHIQQIKHLWPQLFDWR